MCRGAPISLLMRGTRMITGVGLVCVFVLDMDEAREFYTDKLGLEVGVDMVRDGVRWLTVHSPDQPEVPIMLVDPTPPVVDGDRLSGSRRAHHGRLPGDIPGAQGEGRGVHRRAGGALLRHRCRIPRPVRKPLAAHPAEAGRAERLGPS